MSIYTKKGDKGSTSTLRKDKRISKSSCQTRALGAIDEMNSFLGVTLCFISNSHTKNQVKKVQTNLLTIGSILGGSDLKFSKSQTRFLEKQIDKLELSLPRLANFIHPRGTKSSSHLHFCRAICRKAEREVVSLSEEVRIKSSILMYLNRLSDYLFMLARLENLSAGVEDEVWKVK